MFRKSALFLGVTIMTFSAVFAVADESLEEGNRAENTAIENTLDDIAAPEAIEDIQDSVSEQSSEVPSAVEVPAITREDAAVFEALEELTPEERALGGDVINDTPLPEKVQNDRGLAIAQNIPELELATDNGELMNFDRLVGKKGLVLVFSRSMQWCPFCQLQALELAGAYKDIKRKGYELALVTYDQPLAIKRFNERYNLGYRVLSDMNSKVIKQFDVLDESVDPSSERYGYALPIVFVIDRQGAVEGKLFEEDFKIRPPAQEIVSKLQMLNQ